MITIKNIILLIALICICSSVKAQTIDFKFKAPINQYTSAQFIANLSYLNDKLPKDKVILIELDSNGGSVRDGFTIIEYIKYLNKNGRKVSFIVTNKCMSMCFTVLQSGFKRYATKSAKFMQHTPYTYVTIPITHKGVDKKMLEKLEIRVKIAVLQTKQKMEDVELLRLSLDRKEWRKRTLNDYFFNYQTALNIGAIDGEWK